MKRRPPRDFFISDCRPVRVANDNRRQLDLRTIFMPYRIEDAPVIRTADQATSFYRNSVPEFLN